MVINSRCMLHKAPDVLLCGKPRCKSISVFDNLTFRESDPVVLSITWHRQLCSNCSWHEAEEHKVENRLPKRTDRWREEAATGLSDSMPQRLWSSCTQHNLSSYPIFLFQVLNKHPSNNRKCTKYSTYGKYPGEHEWWVHSAAQTCHSAHATPDSDQRVNGKVSVLCRYIWMLEPCISTISTHCRYPEDVVDFVFHWKCSWSLPDKSFNCEKNMRIEKGRTGTFQFQNFYVCGNVFKGVRDVGNRKLPMTDSFRDHRSVGTATV